MIRKVEIENFKSVRKLEFEIGRVTVLVGANGSGKSNILEAIGFASAEHADKLDHEFLISRGIRAPDNYRAFMPLFQSELLNPKILFSADSDDTLTINIDVSRLALSFGDKSLAPMPTLLQVKHHSPRSLELLAKYFSEWAQRNSVNAGDGFIGESEAITLIRYVSGMRQANNDGQSLPMLLELDTILPSFLIYAPENRELRTFAEEGQIRPLGIRGEGLFRLLAMLAQEDGGAKLAILKEKLQLIDWFEDFEFQQDAMAYERRLLIRDRHLSGDLAYFDQRSANEGFLFLLFYFCLFLSDATPPFFAIDNIDSSLNPKLCTRLMQELVQLAKDNGKQVILTTHNPAILDGLDLNDDEQRLYTVRRNLDGETIVDRICAPKVSEGQIPVRLSDAYMRGLLGGLPNNF